MLAGTYVERLEDTAREDQHAGLPADESPEDADVSFDPSEDENISFDFGVPDEVDTSPETAGPVVAGEGASSTPTGGAWLSHSGRGGEHWRNSEVLDRPHRLHQAT